MQRTTVRTAGERHPRMDVSFSAPEERRQYSHRRTVWRSQREQRSNESCQQSRKRREAKQKPQWTDEVTGNADGSPQRSPEDRLVLPLQALGAAYATWSQRDIHRWKPEWRLSPELFQAARPDALPHRQQEWP